MKTVKIRNRSSVTGEEGAPIAIELGRLANHPSKIVARLAGYGDRAWKGPWDTEAAAIRSICQIYSIDGP